MSTFDEKLNLIKSKFNEIKEEMEQMKLKKPHKVEEETFKEEEL